MPPIAGYQSYSATSPLDSVTTPMDNAILVVKMAYVCLEVFVRWMVNAGSFWVFKHRCLLARANKSYPHKLYATQDRLVRQVSILQGERLQQLASNR